MKEQWKPVKDYEGLYEVSSLGRVRSLDRLAGTRWGTTEKFVAGVTLTYTTKSNRYHRCCLQKTGRKRKYVSVHRLVAEAFIPNPENKPQVNHINGAKKDNRAENLEWNTSKENINHAIESGLISIKGDNHPGAILNEDKVGEIKYLLNKNKLNQTEIGDMFGVTNYAICDIKRGKSGKHVEEKKPALIKELVNS